MGEWIRVMVDGQEHLIARAQVVEVVFATEPATAPDDSGGSYPVEGPGQPVARIVTTATEGGRPHVVEVRGAAADRLHAELHPPPPGIGFAFGGRAGKE